MVNTDSTASESDSTNFTTINSIMVNQPVDSEKFVMQKSPTGAVIRSLVIPGWGQFYVEQYWKTPLILGVSAYLIYTFIDYNSDYNRYSDLYDEEYAKPEEEQSASVLTNYRAYRDSYHNLRDETGLYILGVYVISAVDAYVGAHLFDFNVDDDVAVYLLPDPFTKGVSLNFRLSW